MKPERQHKLDLLFARASKQCDEDHFKSAFRLFLSGARQGDAGAQLMLGNFYCDGKGVNRNRAAALYWYRRAYWNGYLTAAHNIGIVYRDEKKLRLALICFHHAGDADAKLEIAKIQARNQRSKAVCCLKLVCKVRRGEVTETAREEAQALLKRFA